MIHFFGGRYYSSGPSASVGSEISLFRILSISMFSYSRNLGLAYGAQSRIHFHHTLTQCDAEDANDTQVTIAHESTRSSYQFICHNLRRVRLFLDFHSAIMAHSFGVLVFSLVDSQFVSSNPWTTCSKQCLLPRSDSICRLDQVPRHDFADLLLSQSTCLDCGWPRLDHIFLSIVNLIKNDYIIFPTLV